MLDDHTRAHAEHIMALVEFEGLNLLDTLERAGLLLSDDKRIQVQRDTLHMAIAQLDQQQHTVLAQMGAAQTVSGAVRGCVKFLEHLAKALR